MVDSIPEFERPGSPSLEDYLAGLRFELASGAGDKAAVKAELARLTRAPKETAVAPKGKETA